MERDSCKATLEGTIRTFQAETREKIPALMERIIKGVSDALGVKPNFVLFIPSCCSQR